MTLYGFGDVVVARHQVELAHIHFAATGDAWCLEGANHDCGTVGTAGLLQVLDQVAVVQLLDRLTAFIDGAVGFLGQQSRPAPGPC